MQHTRLNMRSHYNWLVHVVVEPACLSQVLQSEFRFSLLLRSALVIGFKESNFLCRIVCHYSVIVCSWLVCFRV